MKKVGDMKLYSFEELLEEDYGKVGTPERDAFERSVDEAVQAYRVGEAIKQARESQNLTQAELGEKMGVQRAQVCRLESGKSITLASMMRAFRALGVQVALEMKGIGGYEFDEANIFEGAFYPCIIAAPYQGALKVQFKEVLVLLLYIL